MKSREIRLAQLPTGRATAADFTVAETEVPEPYDGQVLVRNLGFQVFAAAVTTAIGQDVAGFPGLHPGGVPLGPAVGEVVSGDGFAAGEVVSHWLGWREYALVPAEQCAPAGNVLPDPLLHLSHGWTAYGALSRATEVGPGDTVFVTNAAGAIGSLAGRIARLLGASRVVGSVGSPAKAQRLTAELGYDAAVLRGDADRSLVDQLAEAAPGGLDVVLDIVGGAQLQAAVEAARPGARFALAGALTAQYAPGGGAFHAPVELDLTQLIAKRIRTIGFRANEFPDALPEWNERFAGWLRSGEIDFPHTRIRGIDAAAQALQDTVEGRHLGAVVVEP